MVTFSIKSCQASMIDSGQLDVIDEGTLEICNSWNIFIKGQFLLALAKYLAIYF